MYFYKKYKNEPKYIKKYRKRHLLYFLSDKKIIEKLCIRDIKIDSRSFVFFDEEHKTPKICLLALYINGNYLPYIKRKTQTYEMALMAVLNTYKVIKFVRLKFRKKIKDKLKKSRYSKSTYKYYKMKELLYRY
jgi:hypothetical protein